jgi:hypothetical protein
MLVPSDTATRDIEHGALFERVRIIVGIHEEQDIDLPRNA